MSRTDKTRPWWVRIEDCLVEVHDHRNGVCEIAGVPPSRETVGFRPRCCYYDGREAAAEMKCPCSMCRFVWPDKRRRRRDARQGTRSWWREYD